MSLVQGLLPGGGHGHGHIYGDHSGHGYGEGTWDGGSSILSNDYDDTEIDGGSIDFTDTDYY